MTELRSTPSALDRLPPAKETEVDKPPPEPDPPKSVSKLDLPKMEKQIISTKRTVPLQKLETVQGTQARKRSHLQTIIGKQLDTKLIGKKRKTNAEVNKFIPSPQEAPANDYGKWNFTPQLIPTNTKLVNQPTNTTTFPP